MTVVAGFSLLSIHLHHQPVLFHVKQQSIQRSA